MASRDLVGRPLVPFFDSDENVNDAMELGEGDDEREEMDVDARVWDKELGYFVYPSEQQVAGSKPVPIATPNRGSKTDSGAKLLLTPSMMLSSSAPEHSRSMAASGNPVQATADGASTRSNSAKRGSKQKSRSSTPRRRRKDNEGGEEANASSSKKGKNKGGNGNVAQTSNHKSSGRNQLSSSGKWAWSAFQSSPDPAQLPMPPFLTKPGGGLNNGSSAAAMPAPPLPPTPPLPAPHRNVPIAPPLPPGPPPAQPLRPPLPAGPPPGVTTPAPMSIELSMTQDLRRMLNIGGG